MEGFQSHSNMILMKSNKQVTEKENRNNAAAAATATTILNFSILQNSRALYLKWSVVDDWHYRAESLSLA